MKMKYRIILICSVAISLISASGSLIRKSGQAIQWQRWQYALKSVRELPYQPLNVNVFFKGPGGRSFTSHAYTDDNHTYTFRAAFPAPGIWSWNTVCSDPGNPDLHNRSGKVEVSEYSGENPLYRHGDIRVSANHRYLVHADGTPFLWMGDTGWSVTLRSTMDEWRYYVDTRAKQGFSVIQISPRGEGEKELAAESKDLSVTENGTPDVRFWEDLEEKISYANDEGIAILLTGTGNAWKMLMAEREANQEFEKYITGRLASYIVMFSPSFDQLYSDDLAKAAAELQLYTQHLVTQHPGTDYEANIKFRNSSVDFCGEQSGHHNGRLTQAYRAARQWTLDLYNGNPAKPVIDLEAMYDAYGSDSAKNWREKDARKLGWISWMSGSRGYTYGCGDLPPKVPDGKGAVWAFNKDSASYDYWKKAMLWPSAAQMTIMRNFLRSIEWWNLMPAKDLVLNQEQADTLQMTVSLTTNKATLVAYLPDNPEIVLDIRDLPEDLVVSWFNPRNGEFISHDHMQRSSGSQKFIRPTGWEDAVLKLTGQVQ